MAKTITMVAPMGISAPAATAKYLTDQNRKDLSALGLANFNTSSTLSSGGRAASQAAAQAAADARKTQQANSLRFSMGNDVIGQLAPYASNNRDFLDRSKYQNYKTEEPAAPAGGAGGGGGGDVISQASDPYASLYALYEQSWQAQQDALRQQREARLGALQSQYQNAKSRLDSAFDSGETALNQNADEALRQAYISNKLNQRDMAQYLAGQGITGGAAESILANLYNSYGNSRNDIERGRADDLRALLANYQGTLGDLESNYSNNMANLDADYSGNYASAIQNYYDKIAQLQQQNIANQYKSSLGKSGSSSTSTSEINSTIANGLKNHKGNLSAAKAYLSYMGVPEAEQDLYLWNAGFDLTPEGQAQAQTKAYEDALAGIDANTRNTIVNDLKRVYPTSTRDGMSANDSVYANVINLLNQYARKYGLTDTQAQALLAEAGF